MGEETAREALVTSDSQVTGEEMGGGHEGDWSAEGCEGSGWGWKKEDLLRPQGRVA